VAFSSSARKIDPSGAEARIICDSSGTAEAVPFHESLLLCGSAERRALLKTCAVGRCNQFREALQQIEKAILGELSQTSDIAGKRTGKLKGVSNLLRQVVTSVILGKVTIPAIMLERVLLRTSQGKSPHEYR
jgi:hypothetical protein